MLDDVAVAALNAQSKRPLLGTNEHRRVDVESVELASNPLGRSHGERSVAATEFRDVVKSLDLQPRQDQGNVEQRFPILFFRHAAIADFHSTACADRG